MPFFSVKRTNVKYIEAHSSTDIYIYVYEVSVTLAMTIYIYIFVLFRVLDIEL